jgi:hypothetical protein
VFEHALTHDIGSLSFSVTPETLLAYARHDSVSDGDIPITDIERFASDSGVITYQHARFQIEARRDIEMRVLLRRKPDLQLRSTPRLVLDVVSREPLPDQDVWGYALRRTEGVFSLRLGFPGSLVTKLPFIRDIPRVENTDYAILLPGPPPGCLQFLHVTEDGSVMPLTEICSIHLDHVEEGKLSPSIRAMYDKLLGSILRDVAASSPRR